MYFIVTIRHTATLTERLGLYRLSDDINKLGLHALVDVSRVVVTIRTMAHALTFARWYQQQENVDIYMSFGWDCNTDLYLTSRTFAGITDPSADMDILAHLILDSLALDEIKNISTHVDNHIIESLGGRIERD